MHSSVRCRVSVPVGTISAQMLRAIFMNPQQTRSRSKRSKEAGQRACLSGPLLQVPNSPICHPYRCFEAHNHRRKITTPLFTGVHPSHAFHARTIDEQVSFSGRCCQHLGRLLFPVLCPRNARHSNYVRKSGTKSRQKRILITCSHIIQVPPPHKPLHMLGQTMASILDEPRSPGGRIRSRGSNVELACLAVNSCGFTQSSSRGTSVMGTPPNSTPPSRTPSSGNEVLLPEPQSDKNLSSEGSPLLRTKSDETVGSREGSVRRRLERATAGESGADSKDPGLSRLRRTRSMSPLNPRKSLEGSPHPQNGLERTPCASVAESGTESEGESPREEETKVDSEKRNGIESSGTEVKEGDKKGSPSESPRWYKHFAPAPLVTETETSMADSAAEASRRSFSQWLPGQSSPPGAKGRLTGTGNTIPRNPAEQGRLSGACKRSSGKWNKWNERSMEGSFASPLSSQSRTSSKPTKNNHQVSETFELDPAAVERLTEQITEQILSQLSPAMGTHSSSPGRVDSNRVAEWGPWRVSVQPRTETPILDDEVRPGDSSFNSSPRGSRSPKGRTAYTDHVASAERPAEPRDRPATSEKERTLSPTLDTWKSKRSVPWQFELTRSHSSDAIADRLNGTTSPRGFGVCPDASSDVGSSMRRSGSSSTLDSMYAPFKGTEEGSERAYRGGSLPGFQSLRENPVFSATWPNPSGSESTGVKRQDAGRSVGDTGGRGGNPAQNEGRYWLQLSEDWQKDDMLEFLTGLGLRHYAETLQRVSAQKNRCLVGHLLS